MQDYPEALSLEPAEMPSPGNPTLRMGAWEEPNAGWLCWARWQVRWPKPVSKAESGRAGGCGRLDPQDPGAMGTGSGAREGPLGESEHLGPGPWA